MHCLTIGDVVKITGTNKVPLQYDNSAVPKLAPPTSSITPTLLSKMDISAVGGGGGYVNGVIKQGIRTITSYFPEYHNYAPTFSVYDGKAIRIGFCNNNPWAYKTEDERHKSDVIKDEIYDYDIYLPILDGLNYSGDSTAKIYTNYDYELYDILTSFYTMHIPSSVKEKFLYTYMHITFDSGLPDEYSEYYSDEGEYESVVSMIDSIQARTKYVIYDAVSQWFGGQHMERLD